MTAHSFARSALTLAFLASLLGGIPKAASAANQDSAALGEEGASTFGDVSDVIVVEIPVQVVRKGRPVLGLEARDFRILDQGVPRTLSSFEVIDFGNASARRHGETPVGAPTGLGAERRTFLLLFDLAFSTPHDLSKAERAARELLEGGLHPHDLVGVAAYSPRRGAVLLVNFTPDRAQVRRVLDGLRLLLDGRRADTVDDGAAGGRRDPLGLTAGTVEAVLADLGTAAGVETSLAQEALDKGWVSLGGWGDIEVEKVVNMMWSAEQQIDDRRAGKVADLSRSLASLARQTAGIRGSKHLVMLSGGFDADLLEVGPQAGPRHPVKNAWWSPGGGSWILSEVLTMIDELRRAGWVLHAVDLGGTAARGSFTEGLFYVARGTGGTIYENANDLSVALADVVAATSVTYLLTFTVEELPSEPEFREIQVLVDGLPRGARVSHRAGYHPPRAWQELSSGERRADTLDLLFSGSDRDPIGSHLRALPFRRPEGGTGIAVVLDLDGAVLAAGPADEPAGAEIYGYAFDAEGRVVDFFAHRVAVSDDEARELLTSSGIRFLGDFDVPDGGRYRVRLLARSLRDGSASVRTVEVNLAPTAPVRVAETPPLAGANGERTWLVVREVSALAEDVEK